MTTMPTIHRLSQPGHEPITDVDSSQGVERAIQSGEPGRYHVDQISAEALLSGHTSPCWGVGIKRADGTVTVDPDPWPDR
jgi:hypothetical protein